MTARRLLLFVALLLLVSAMASAVAPRERDIPPQTPQRPATPARAADVVRATFPDERELRARVGDVVELEVRNEGRDVVQIPALGLAEPVERDLPAQLVFDADRAGRFAVSLRDERRRVGTVEVLPPR